MQSPLASPSLRAITHAHPHLPRTGSYFTSHPSCPAPPRYVNSPHSPHAAYHASTYATLAQSPLASPRPHAGTHDSYHPSPPIPASYAPSSPRAPASHPRGPALRTSAIPLKPTPPAMKPHLARMTATTTAPDANGESGRRRPSFKIDLPPRPVPFDIMSHQPACQSTPFPVARDHAIRPHSSRAVIHQEGDVTATNTALNASPRVNGATVRDPFLMDGEYIILHGSPDLPLPYDGVAESRLVDRSDAQSVQMQGSWTGAGVVGLGYTLNKLRAPTPWIRGKEFDEWLNAQDMADIEVSMRGLGVA